MLLRSSILFCTLIPLTFGDTLYLRSGATIQGNYAGGDTRQVKFLVGDRVETYRIGEVQRVEFGGGTDNPPADNAAVSTPPPPPRYRDEGTRQADSRPPDSRPPDSRPAERFDRATPPPPEGAYPAVEIPAGTNLVVRMIDSVDSERDSVGKTFRASIDEPVVVNGQTVIPRGADVVAKLVNQAESGKFQGRTSLTLDLMQIQINGRMVDITTSEVTQASGSRGNRTAKTVGGGAAVGAILGGIFGGGKGAAIGAASGGALGAGAEVATKGQKVKIPSETRLSFLLQQPLRP